MRFSKSIFSRAISRTLLVLAVVLALTSTSAQMVSADTPAASIYTGTAAVELDASTIRFLSTDEYRASQSTTRATADNPDSGGADVAKDPIQYWYSVAYSTLDGAGRDWPIRVGTTDWGRDHFAVKHNLRDPNAVLAAFDTTPEFESGTHFEFKTVVTNGGVAVMDILVVGEQAETTTDGAYTTPDGRPIGVITAYCVGMDVCPDWVNSGA